MSQLYSAGRPAPIVPSVAQAPAGVLHPPLVGASPAQAPPNLAVPDHDPLPSGAPAPAPGPAVLGATPDDAVPAVRTVRRAVRVAAFDRLSRQVEDVVDGASKTAAKVEALEEEVRITRNIRRGFDVLQAVAQQQQYPCGRALQRVLGQRLLERLKSTPTRPASRGPSVSGRAGQEQVAITFDVPFTRSGLDELVAMCGLSYAPRVGRRTARPVRAVHFAGPVALLQALELMAVADSQQLLCRRFTRLDQSKPARPLLERILDEDGSVFYVIDRNIDTGDVIVAVRESETYDVRRQAFKHPLERKTVPIGSLPGLSTVCPCFLSWRESVSSAGMEWEGVNACGSVSLSVPCCTFEQLPADVAALAQSLG